MIHILWKKLDEFLVNMSHDITITRIPISWIRFLVFIWSDFQTRVSSSFFRFFLGVGTYRNINWQLGSTIEKRILTKKQMNTEFFKKCNSECVQYKDCDWQSSRFLVKMINILGERLMNNEYDSYYVLGSSSLWTCQI